RNVLGRQRRRLALRLLELGQLVAADRVRPGPPADRRQRRDRVQAPRVRAEMVQARRAELADLRVEEWPKSSRGTAERQLAEGRAEVLVDHRNDGLRPQPAAVALEPEVHELAEGAPH